jgi:phosphocarrier protein
MYERTVTISNTLGLHARPAALMVQTIYKYKSEVHITKDSISANGRSIMSVLMLAAEPGSQITIVAKGDDEVEVVNALIQLIENRFFED